MAVRWRRSAEFARRREIARRGFEPLATRHRHGERPTAKVFDAINLWHTKSNENEDSGVMLIQEWSSFHQPLDFEQPQPFSVCLPGTVVTCNAELNQIRGMVRLRVRWAPDWEMYSETPFLLVQNDTCSTMSQGEKREFRGKLAHRLDTDFFGNAVGPLIAAIYINGVFGFLLFLAIHVLFAFPGNRAFSLFMIPLSLLAIVTVGLPFVFSFVTLLMAGPIRFELSRHPLVVGTSCQYMVEQCGRFRIRDLQLKLRCIESTTYKGTRSTRVARRVLFQQTVAGAQYLGEYGLFGLLCVPDDVMPSYKAGDTKVEWELHFSGWVARILPFSNSYPVIVYRADAT